MPVPARSPLPSVQKKVESTIDTLFSYLEAQGQGDYLGEGVSQLEHSLQAAHLAAKAGADHETILASLLHDVGRFIPNSDYHRMPTMIAPNGTFVGRGSHEVVGEDYLRSLGFSDKVCELVGSHVWAKRYLTAVNPGYYATLSETSKVTLKYQGGPLTEKEVKDALKDPWLDAKLALRRWDDEAKTPGLEVPPLVGYRTVAVQSLTRMSFLGKAHLGSRSSIELHGRSYKLPIRPTVAICVDGFDPEYLEQGIKDGILPNLSTLVETGTHYTATCAMPSFTNPNNCSIITGAPTAVHGIAGNFYLDKETGQEHLVLDDSLLRGSTILQLMSERGVRVAAITAKDKLRRIIQHGLTATSGDICFSSEYANKCTVKENGIQDVEEYIGRRAPPQYSGDLSLFVLDAGIKLLREGRADLFYLTLSDYVQHKHEPGSREANEFLSALDDKIGQLLELGAVVGVTGDHGMSDKTLSDGTPNVLYVQDEIERRFQCKARVIAPITDPFVVHHGALGSFVRIHMQDRTPVADIIAFLETFPQIDLVLTGEQAADRFQMPLDREGDIVVVSAKNAVLGSKESEHDLSNLKGHRLRSHGGLSEERIPLISNVHGIWGERAWRNFDIFDLILNYQ